MPVSNDSTFSARGLLRVIMAVTNAAPRMAQYRARESKVAPISRLTPPTNGLLKAVDALTHTGFAREWVEIGKTCNNIHKQGTNRTVKAVGLSSREKRFSSLVGNVSPA